MPAGVYPLALRRTKTSVTRPECSKVPRAKGKELVRHGGVAIDLDFGFGKLEFGKHSVPINIDNLMSQDYG
jgi:hypothetical protein